MYSFEMHKATSVANAAALLAQSGGKALAGGQSLIAAMKLRLAQPGALVDLSGIAELKAEWQMDLEIPFSSGSDSTTSNRLAVSAFHDANTNSRLDKNSFGIPTERYGFSKNPKRGFGPPKFIETALELDLPDSPNDSNVVVEVPIQIK